MTYEITQYHQSMPYTGKILIGIQIFLTLLFISVSIYYLIKNRGDKCSFWDKLFDDFTLGFELLSFFLAIIYGGEILVAIGFGIAYLL